MILYQASKALHVIAIVSWFSGMFYIGRIFIYHELANKKPNEREILQSQFEIMMRRVWFAIIIPALIVSLVTGTYLAVKFKIYKEGWFHVKLLFIFGLLFYNHLLGKIRKNLNKKTNKLSSFKLRLINELATLFLLTIVFIAYLKSLFNTIWGVIGIASIFLLLGLFIIAIKKSVKKEN